MAKRRTESTPGALARPTPLDNRGRAASIYIWRTVSAEQEVDRWVPSAAVLHSNGDGLDIAVRGGRIVGVRGRADDRVNHGRLDTKDLFGWQATTPRTGSPRR